ncbi:MAG: hypothetical protein NWF01_00140 [Candidatus Bathyarchaeota archaeon]|nr:hypothetical protein [Candidatus Bathyarchaeota archaeon]
MIFDVLLSEGYFFEIVVNGLFFYQTFEADMFIPQFIMPSVLADAKADTRSVYSLSEDLVGFGVEGLMCHMLEGHRIADFYRAAIALSFS